MSFNKNVNIWYTIFIYLPIKHRKAFSKVTPFLEEVYDYFEKDLVCPAGYTLYNDQLELYKRVKNAWDYRWKTIIAKASMGSGKTAIMLMIANHIVTNGDNAIILINNKVMSTWLMEMEKFKLRFNRTNVNESDIIILHSSCEPHLKYVKTEKYIKELKKILKKEKKIFITTPHYLQTYNKLGYIRTHVHKNYGMYEPIQCGGFGHIYDQGFSIIVDEAHTIKNDAYTKKNCLHKKILISASPINSKDSARSTTHIDVSNVKDEEILYPNIECEYEFYDEQLNRCVYLGTSNNNCAIVYKILEKYKSYDNIVLFFENQTIIDDIIKKIKHIPEFDSLKRKYIKFVNSTSKSIKEFNENKNSVMFCSYLTSCEGTNFDKSSCAIFFNYNSLGLEKARQCIGRIRRRNNYNKSVKLVFAIYNPSNDNNVRNFDNEVEIIRSRLNTIYATDLEYPFFEKKTKHFMVNILKYLDKHNICKNQFDLTEADIITLFTTSWLRLFNEDRAITNFNVNNINEDLLLKYNVDDYTIPIKYLLNLTRMSLPNG